MKINPVYLSAVCVAMLYSDIFANQQLTETIEEPYMNQKQFDDPKIDRSSSRSSISTMYASDSGTDQQQFDNSKIDRSSSYSSISTINIPDMDQLWFEAAESGDLSIMQSLYAGNNFFKEGIYRKDNSGRTALEIAVINGRCNVAEWLANRTEERERVDGASYFNLKSSIGYKPMMIIAIENGHECIVKLMLLRAMNPNTIFDLSAKGFGKTPLIIAAEKGLTGIVNLLLTSKNDPLLLKLGHSRSDPNQQDSLKRTALMYASKHGYGNIVELLLQNGANPNKKDSSNYTALMSAIINGHEFIAQMLLRYGADPNIQNNDKKTALMYAVEKGYWNLTGLLLDLGAKINIEDKKHRTALDYAEENAEMTALLMNYVNRPENQQKASLGKRIVNTFTKKKLLKRGTETKNRLSDSQATLYDPQINYENSTIENLSPAIAAY